MVSDPGAARIVIDPHCEPGVAHFSSTVGVWRVHSETEARMISSDPARWTRSDHDTEPSIPPLGQQVVRSG